jgi:excisionase family DNA binding protein
MDNKYFSLDDVSKILKMAKSTLYAYVGKNKIPFIKIGGKLLFSENDMNIWIDSMKQTVSEKEDAK